jgi:hypothetical protein
MPRHRPRPTDEKFSVPIPNPRQHVIPPDGMFRVVMDNSPISLEGELFSGRQIARGLALGVFRPGMRFRHQRQRRVDFVLTPAGLAWPAPGEASRVHRND